MTCEYCEVDRGYHLPSCKILKGHKLEPIPTEFFAYEYDRKQTKRTKKAALYCLTYRKNNDIVRYEVYQIIGRVPESMFGKDYPYREAVPPSELWGYNAWTFIDFQEANRKYKELNGKP